MRPWIESRLVRTFVCSVLIGACLTAVAWAAFVNNMVGNPNYNYPCVDGGLCHTDNTTLTYYSDSNGEYELEPVDKTAVNATMSNQFAPTDLNPSYDNNPTFSGTAETDVVYQEGATGIPTGSDGMAWCNDSSPGATYECDQQYVRIRGNGNYTNGLTCHETGHAVGLLHGANASPTTSQTDPDLGCMQTPVGPNVGIGTNQRNRINNTY